MGLGNFGPGCCCGTDEEGECELTETTWTDTFSTSLDADYVAFGSSAWSISSGKLQVDTNATFIVQTYLRRNFNISRETYNTITFETQIDGIDSATNALPAFNCGLILSEGDASTSTSNIVLVVANRGSGGKSWSVNGSTPSGAPTPADLDIITIEAIWSGNNGDANTTISWEVFINGVSLATGNSGNRSFVCGYCVGMIGNISANSTKPKWEYFEYDSSLT